ncbi:MAG: aldehyde dehydrogenase family protein, partial [Actinomycetota bacterium]
MNRIGHWVNNKVVLGTSGRSGVVFNPATGEEQAKVDFASVAEMDAVVAAAKAALPGWRSTSLSRRAEIMFRMRELVDANRKEIANIVSLEHGKVPADAMGELARGLENLEFACGIPALLKGGYSEQAAGGVDVYSIRQPLGVVAGITPFNFPAMNIDADGSFSLGFKTNVLPRMNQLAIISPDHCPFCFKDQKDLGLGYFSKIP